MGDIHQFIQFIKANFADVPNTKSAVKVLKCLAYIEANQEKLIRDIVTNKWALVRDPDHTAIHVAHLKTETAVRDFFGHLVAQIKTAIKTIQDYNNRFITHAFIENFRDSDVGCMEVRMGQALQYVGMLESNGGVLSLDNMMENFASTWQANGLTGDDEIACFKAALEYFGHFVDIHYPVQSDKEVVPLTWNMIQTYFSKILAWDVDSKWVEIEQNLRPPVEYQETDKRGHTWYLLHFEEEAGANLYLSFVKSMLPPDMQHDIAQARVIKQGRGGYRFRMTVEQYSIFELQKQKVQASLVSSSPDVLSSAGTAAAASVIDSKGSVCSADYLIKTLRSDKGSFFRSLFVKGITRSDKQQVPIPLRPFAKRAWTVTGDGVFERAKKKPKYKPEEKKYFSPYQSMTLVSESIRPTPFGHAKARRDKLVGAVFSLKPENALLGRLYVYDGGTVGRPYDHETKAAAEEYYKKKTDKNNRILFADVELFKKRLKEAGGGKRMNEILARIKWNTDGTSRVCIFSDTFEARLLAQDYARILRTQLRAQLKENGLLLDARYTVPICFYTPDAPDPFERVYTKEERAQDCEDAREICLDERRLKEKIAEGNYEFLLGLEDSGAVFRTPELIRQMLDHGDYYLVESLLEKDSQLEQKQLKLELYSQYFVGAAKKGHFGIINWLVNLGIEVNLGNQAGATALICAACNGYVEVVKILLAVDGIEVNLKNQNDYTALIWAARYGHVEVVKLLLAKDGIEVNHQDNAGYTALIWAARYNDYTALIWAARNGHVEVVKLLLAQAGIEVNLGNQAGATALICAACNGYVEVVKILLAVDGIEVNLKNQNGDTALIWAARNGRVEVVRLLLAKDGIEVGKNVYVKAKTSEIKKLLYPKYQLTRYIREKERRGISSFFSGFRNPELIRKQKAAAQALLNVIDGDETDLAPHIDLFKDSDLKNIFDQSKEIYGEQIGGALKRPMGSPVLSRTNDSN